MSVKEGYRPRDLRIKMYNDVLQLREHGLGYKKIRRRIKEIYGEKLSLSTISHWIRGTHSPYNGRRIPSIEFLKPSRELAEIIGMEFGDGTATMKSKRRNGYNEVRISLKAKDKEFVERFACCLGIVLGRETPKLYYIQSDQRYSVSVRD